MKLTLRFFIGLVLLFTKAAFADTKDSLFTVYKSQVADSIRFKAIDDFVWEYMYENPDTAFQIASKIFLENKSTDYHKGLPLLLRTMGASFVLRGANSKGIVFYSLSREICELLKDNDGAASSSNGLGIIYSRQGNYSKAIEEYLSSLAAYERAEDKDGMAIAYNNIGLNYERQAQFQKALDYYFKSLTIKLAIGKSLGVAQAKINIGNTLISLKKYDKALNYFNEALIIQKELGNTALEATIYNSIGIVYQEQKKYDAAVDYFMKAIVLKNKMEDKYGATDIRNNLGVINNILGRYAQAASYAEESYEAAKEMENMEMIKQSSNTLSYAYEHLGKESDALKFYKIFNAYKDSVYNKDNTEKSIQAELKYEFSKQAEKEKQEHEKKELEQTEAAKRQVIIRNSLILGFLLLLILAFLIFRNLKQKQKANRKLQGAYSEIEVKSNLLESKNKEVFDSIKYAKRLQEAILPNNEFIKKLFPESFVFYKPKDIVSGDFYWFEHWGDRKMFAAVDCTGHGVPGAFMSIVGYNLLSQAVNEHGLTKPNLILNELNKGITRTLKQTFEDSAVKDGMDIALCAFDEKNNVLEYAGAFNALWLLRNNVITEIKGDKHPVGLFLGEELKPFAIQQVAVQKGDVFYVFTDGFADQFGGPKGKKFKYKQLQELLLSVAGKPMDEQKAKLDNTIDSWRGDLEQVDDILVIGVRF